MSSLITCDKVLEALTSRLKTASQTEIQMIKDILGIVGSVDTTVSDLQFDKTKGVITLTSSDGNVLTADFCGWQPKPPCEFHATLSIVTERDECGGNFSRVIWGFHPDDLRDPKADVRLEDCKGGVLGYIYSERAGLHTEPVYAYDEQGTRGELLGYGLRTPTIKYPLNDDCGCTQGEE